MESNEGTDYGDGEVCRNFLRGLCRRGQNCRFRHPNGVHLDGKDSNKFPSGEMDFCRDFQNAGCKRLNCRFVHCSREDEEQFKQTGQLPAHIRVGSSLPGVANNEIPVCMDFLKGDCKRAGRCKYRHVTQGQYDMEKLQKERLVMVQQQLYVTQQQLRTQLQPQVQLSIAAQSLASGIEAEKELLVAGVKRRYVDDVDRPVRTPEYYQMIEEENIILRQKVEQLRKQVTDLTATNDLLLEQNVRYRSSQALLRASATGAPIMTVSSLASLTQQPMTVTAASGAELLMSQQPQLAMEFADQSSRLGGTATLCLPGSLSSMPALDQMNNLVTVTITQPTFVGAANVSMAQQSLALISGQNPSLMSYPIMSQSAPMQTNRIG